MGKKALVLFGHGARDAGWAEPFRRLQAMTQSQLPEVDVRLAFLELMSPRLPELVAELAAAGITEITVVPVFFGQGGHVLRDLPAMLSRLQGEYPGLALSAVPAVGEDALVLQAIASYCGRAVGGS